MSKKLQGNGLFESSRMMLPEHKEAYLKHQRQLHQKQRPLLDEQAIEAISGLLAESMQTGKEITVVLFGEREDTTITGKVARINRQTGEIKLTNGTDVQSVKFENIIDAYE